jgi:hypothetical protein
MTDNDLYIEEILLNSVKKLLAGQVNECLGETEFPIPLIEFGRSLAGGYAVSPVLRLSTSERTEKDRVIQIDVYTLTIAFSVPECPDGERTCYAYTASVAAALGEDPTLGGAADRAELTGKKYTPPKQSRTGGDWEVVLTLRVTVEGGC